MVAADDGFLQQGSDHPMMLHSGTGKSLHLPCQKYIIKKFVQIPIYGYFLT